MLIGLVPIGHDQHYAKLRVHIQGGVGAESSGPAPRVHIQGGVGAESSGPAPRRRLRRLAPRRVLFWSPRSHRRFHALVLRHPRKGRQRKRVLGRWPVADVHHAPMRHLISTSCEINGGERSTHGEVRCTHDSCIFTVFTSLTQTACFRSFQCLPYGGGFFLVSIGPRLGTRPTLLPLAHPPPPTAARSSRNPGWTATM